VSTTLLLVVLAAADPGSPAPALPGPALLGAALRQDGYQVRPPSTFHMARMDLFHGTRAGCVALAASTPRYLSAALLDRDGEDASTMLIAIIEAPLSLGPSSRDELSTAVLRHFRDELDQPFVLERAEVQGQAAPRVQVLGSVRAGSQLRRILVAAFPGDGRHVVVLFSVPSGRWDELRPTLEASLDTLRPELPQAGPPRQWRWAFAALMGSLLLLSVGLWKRRQASRGEAG
jgi:hypothetical protein